MKVLILGKIPPPSGGVRIHVIRLLGRLKEEGLDYDFFDMSRGVIQVFKTAIRYRVIHLHTSHAYFRFIFALFCKILNIKLLQTYHGDLGRFGRFKNAFDLASVRISKVPIVINQGSYEKAKKLNTHASLISSFVAPVTGESLEEGLSEALKSWSSGFDTIFCTNASCLKYDKHGKEVYGGSALLRIFADLPGRGLVFSDPSAEYKKHFEDMALEIPPNLFLITGEHSLMEVIKRSDCLIRASTTDGDSVSIKEALYLSVPVIASDCVDRPRGCELYPTENFKALGELLRSFLKGPGPDPVNFDEVSRIIELYRKYL